MASRLGIPIKIFDAQASTGSSIVVPTVDYRHVILTVATTGSADMTIKFQGSTAVLQKDDIDFTAAASPSNPWDYKGVWSLQDSRLTSSSPAGYIPGDTGLVFSGTDSVEEYILNHEGMRFFCATITAHSSGNVTIWVTGFSNQ